MRLFLALLLWAVSVAEQPAGPALTAVSPAEAAELQAEVVSLFNHAYSSYLTHAFPKDVLQPLSCSGRDQWKGMSMTLIDALDALAIMGNRSAFAHALEHCVQHVTFDTDQNVSVFETTIRALGGLLSAHALASDPSLRLLSYPYPPADGSRDLLSLAIDLGDRLLPAFDTPTAIPYGTVNLRHGVPPGESPIACTAAAGSLTLEFGALSRLSGDRRYHVAAQRASKALWELRSGLDLVGAHIDTMTGRWTQQDAGVGRGIDSFYEYMLKDNVLFADGPALDRFRAAYVAVEAHTKVGDAYVEVSMRNGQLIWPISNALQAFWPGVQALAGDVNTAARSARLFRAVRDRCGWLPEGFNLQQLRAEGGQRSHPLRPELAESLLFLHHATGGHPEWRLAGRDLVHGLAALRVPCGIATVADVRTGLLHDSMESFLFAETLKYLFLLFDEPSPKPSPAGAEREQRSEEAGRREEADGWPANRAANMPPARVYEHGRFVFSTEGHLLPHGLPPLPPPPRPEGAEGGAQGQQDALMAISEEAAQRGTRKLVRWRGACALPTWRQRLGVYGKGLLQGGAGRQVGAAMLAAATLEEEDAAARQARAAAGDGSLGKSGDASDERRGGGNGDVDGDVDRDTCPLDGERAEGSVHADEEAQAGGEEKQTYSHEERGVQPQQAEGAQPADGPPVAESEGAQPAGGPSAAEAEGAGRAAESAQQQQQVQAASLPQGVVLLSNLLDAAASADAAGSTGAMEGSEDVATSSSRSSSKGDRGGCASGDCTDHGGTDIEGGSNDEADASETGSAASTSGETGDADSATAGREGGGSAVAVAEAQRQGPRVPDLVALIRETLAKATAMKDAALSAAMPVTASHLTAASAALAARAAAKAAAEGAVAPSSGGRAEEAEELVSSRTLTADGRELCMVWVSEPAADGSVAATISFGGNK